MPSSRTRKGALDRVLDRLFGSPRYGAHLGRIWLDAARYADTHGLHLDNLRLMWPYRDWVIDAYNRNLPFDQFTIEQLAGDLLPDATEEQRIASGFNRCNPTSAEGGMIAEEYLSIYAKDRTDTTSTVFLGVSMGCAQCHDHKYDRSPSGTTRCSGSSTRSPRRPATATSPTPCPSSGWPTATRARDGEPRRADRGARRGPRGQCPRWTPIKRGGRPPGPRSSPHAGSSSARERGVHGRLDAGDPQ